MFIKLSLKFENNRALVKADIKEKKELISVIGTAKGGRLVVIRGNHSPRAPVLLQPCSISTPPFNTRSA
jgi:hypothetical protein